MKNKKWLTGFMQTWVLLFTAMWMIFLQLGFDTYAHAYERGVQDAYADIVEAYEKSPAHCIPHDYTDAFGGSWLENSVVYTRLYAKYREMEKKGYLLYINDRQVNLFRLLITARFNKVDACNQIPLGNEVNF